MSHGNKQARQHGEGRGGKGRVVGKKVCLKRDLEKKRGFLCLVWQIKSDSMDKDIFSLSNELCLVTIGIVFQMHSCCFEVPSNTAATNTINIIPGMFQDLCQLSISESMRASLPNC